MTSSACHTTGDEQATSRHPWADHPRDADKDALLAYAVENREGTPAVCAARDVLDRDAEAGGADHRFALRFYSNHPSLFRTERRDGLVWVWPRAAVFTCPANKHSPKHADGDGVRYDTPKTSARSALGRRRMVESDADRGYLLAALATYRETTAGRYHHLESRVDGEPDLLVPYVTRFNSSRRVAEAAERFEGAFDRAAREFDDAVVVTLTTDPSRFDSLLDAAGSLTEDVNRFKSWLATEGRLGYRPPSVVVPEFTESGLPHVHVVLFGVSWVVSHEVLSAYWSGRRGRAEVVWFDRLVSRGVGGRWRWADGGPSDVEGRSPRSYLSKGLGVAAEFAAASPEEVREASQALRAVVEGEDTAECPESLSGSESARDDERGRTSRGRGTVGGGVVGDETGTEGEASSALARGRRWWRLALYYATDLRWFTASPSLTGADDDEGEEGEGECLPYVSRYRYVGTARYSEFPGYVRARARVCRYDRPPPSGSSHVSARGP